MSSFISVLDIVTKNQIYQKEDAVVCIHSFNHLNNKYVRQFSLSVADLGGCEGRAPPGGQNSFNFMQFLGNFGKIVCWTPSPGSWHPLLGENLDPPLPVEELFVNTTVHIHCPQNTPLKRSLNFNHFLPISLIIIRLGNGKALFVLFD